MIDSMFQQGTDAALADQVQRPRITPPASPPFSLFGLGLAAPQGIGSGVAKSIAFGAEMTGAFGQVEGAYSPASAGGMFSTQTDQERKQADTAREKVAREGVDYSNEAGDTFRRRATDILPDPRTTHASQQVVAGLFDYGTRALGYGLTLGPLAPAAFGGDVGMEESDRLKQQGVDLGTRTKAGAVAGVLNAAAVAVPLTGATAAVRFVKGAVTGEASIVGQAAAEKAILAHAGYDKIADTFDPYDPVALTLGVVPGVLGAVVGHGAPAAVRKPHAGEAPGFGELQAAADAARADADRIPVLQAEQAKEATTPAEKVRLQREIDRIQATGEQVHAQVVEGAIASDPDLVHAARVGQVVDALDSSRLTPDTDLAGRDAHVSAVELAHDQMARGEDVSVSHLIPDPEQPLSRVRIEDTREGLHVFALDDRSGQQVGSGLAHETSEAVRIRNIGIDAPEAKGNGLGVEAYQEWADYALQRGKTLMSDNQVSLDAQHIYAALERRGYTIERNPKAITEPDGTLYSRGWGVFKVTSAPEGRVARVLRTAAAAEQLRAVDTMRGPLEPVLRADDPHLTRLDPAARDVLGDRYARAARDKPAFDSILQGIADESGSQAKLAGLKGSERAVDKVLHDYGGDASRIKDVLRGTIQVDSVDQARQVIAALHQRFNVLDEGKRNLLDPLTQPADGYRDAKFNVDLGGHTAEVQVNLPSMLAAKKEVHALYARREKLIREARDRGDLAMPPEVPALNAKMRAVYDPAWAKALETSARNADSSTGLPLRRAEEGSKGRGAGGSQQMHSEGGTPAPSDTGIPSTSKNSAPSGNLAGRDADFMLTSKQSVTDSVTSRAAEEAAALNPDMLVHMDGMDAPMRVGDLLAKVKEEARKDTLSGKLLEVAAACDLRA